MCDDRGMISAFGVEHGLSKSEVRPGEYKPATQLTEAERESTKRTAKSPRPPSPRATAANRGIGSVYAHSGVTSRSEIDRTMDSVFGRTEASARNDRMNGLINDPTTPSVRHKKISYGESIPASARAKIDAKIDPRMASRLKNPTVIHRRVMASDLAAAAVPAHSTTHGNAHVSINHKYGAGETGGKNSVADTINHELGHTLRHTNPARRDPQSSTDRLKGVREEARADALTGKRQSVKEGNVASKRSLKKMPRENRLRTEAYHDTYDKVINALKKVPR